MTGHRPFRELMQKLPPGSRARVAAKAAAMNEEMTLEHLRKSLDLSQQAVAGRLDAQQPAVAKLEKRGDMHLSTLRQFVEALGGELEVTARFPGATVAIRNPDTEEAAT